MSKKKKIAKSNKFAELQKINPAAYPERKS
jgi:hypothetical protein